ncbi:hypothetical protein [Synechococcus sp. MIT S9510]|uniref:hypothetical protein n=1 Tax=unclassified Synechococcus TaxID=2626047 RepID=UPI0039AEE5DD
MAWGLESGASVTHHRPSDSDLNGCKQLCSDRLRSISAAHCTHLPVEAARQN